jgi:hypothetical protein
VAAMIEVGFPPTYTERVYFRRVSDAELMDAVDEAFRRLGWSPYETGRWEISGSTPWVPFLSYGSQVIARAEGDGELYVRSQSSFPLAWIDWGTNHGHVNALLLKLEDLLDVRARKVRGEEGDK